MRRMSTDPDTPDKKVPPEAASDSGDTADASPSPLLEQTYDQTYDEAIIRLTVIAEEWQKARDALRGG
jgi:hypothetical protein